MKAKDAIKQIVNQIHTSKSILILPHILPDGDTIGSSLALSLALKQMGKDTKVLVGEEIPRNIGFLPCEEISNHVDEESDFDCIISIDCSDEERLGDRKKYFDQCAYTINIDHHITNTFFAKLNWVDEKAAATGEIVYFLIKELNVLLDSKMATCLYTALSTDTGSFKYDNTTCRTHEIAGALLAQNIDLNGITTELYQNKSIGKIRLLTSALNTLEFECDEKVAILTITHEMLKENGVEMEDTNGLIEYARDIEGVQVGILLKEMDDDRIKIGLRSKYHVDVSKIANQFHGGGHKKASGCTLHGNVEYAKEKIIQAVKKYL